MENLRALHPNKKAPIMMELDKLLPSIRDIQTSLVKLREICIPGKCQAAPQSLISTFIKINTKSVAIWVP